MAPAPPHGQGLPPHPLASRLVTAGVDLRNLQELMGDKTMAMTSTHTSHLATKRHAVQRLNHEPAATATAADEPAAKASAACGVKVLDKRNDS